MKKMIVLGLLFGLFTGPVTAQQYDENGAVKLLGLLRGTIHYVHHEKQQLVIDDRNFVMPLNFKVLAASGAKANRFALRTGQAVEYFVRYDDKTQIFYVDSVQLLN
ncbi:hypothetical protein [uncultured Pseudoteredinibacter sp.]|uniref:hypothetical protein n=1 Tax=uncultured Pseudoteredinibacter sp. TaxID=1641701 RepID=UPI00261E551B|nr:hypothetical protein [uncultured Pseudoteredinibacter sp.]